MIKLDNSIPLKIIGDMHYSYEHVLPNLTTAETSSLIFVGDLGGELEFYLKLAKLDHKVFCIRGNHDDPSLFVEGDMNRFFSQQGVYFLKEVSLLTYRDIALMTVGGAISIDRSICYERRKTDISRLAPTVLQKGTKAEILLSHAPPTNGFRQDFCGSFLRQFAEDDPTLIKDVRSEQQMLQQMMNAVGATTSIFGHLHNSYHHQDESGKEYRCLDIGEIYPLNL